MSLGPDGKRRVVGLKPKGENRTNEPFMTAAQIRANRRNNCIFEKDFEDYNGRLRSSGDSSLQTQSSKPESLTRDLPAGTSDILSSKSGSQSLTSHKSHNSSLSIVSQDQPHNFSPVDKNNIENLKTGPFPRQQYLAAHRSLQTSDRSRPLPTTVETFSAPVTPTFTSRINKNSMLFSKPDEEKDSATPIQPRIKKNSKVTLPLLDALSDLNLGQMQTAIKNERVAMEKRHMQSQGPEELHSTLPTTLQSYHTFPDHIQKPSSKHDLKMQQIRDGLTEYVLPDDILMVSSQTALQKSLLRLAALQSTLKVEIRMCKRLSQSSLPNAEELHASEELLQELERRYKEHEEAIKWVISEENRINEANKHKHSLLHMHKRNEHGMRPMLAPSAPNLPHHEFRYLHSSSTFPEQQENAALKKKRGWTEKAPGRPSICSAVVPQCSTPASIRVKTPLRKVRSSEGYALTNRSPKKIHPLMLHPESVHQDESKHNNIKGMEMMGRLAIRADQRSMSIPSEVTEEGEVKRQLRTSVSFDLSMLHQSDKDKDKDGTKSNIVQQSFKIETTEAEIQEKPVSSTGKSNGMKSPGSSKPKPKLFQSLRNLLRLFPKSASGSSSQSKIGKANRERMADRTASVTVADIKLTK